MIPDQFLFINKSANLGSLSHSHQNEKFNIYSHVQAKSHKDKRHAKTGSRTQLSKSTNAGACEPVGRLVPLGIFPTKSRSCQQGSQNLQKSHTLLHGNTVHPFMCSSVRIDSKDQELLYYPSKSFLETTFSAESLVDTTSPVVFRHRNAITQRLQRCVVDDLVMYTTLAYCASCMRWTIGKEERERPAEMYVLKAIVLLRFRLQNAQNPDAWLILSIYALAVSEMWARNYEAATAHLKMTAHFTMQIGGITKLEPYLMESIILCDKYVAIGKFDRPVFPLDWQPDPLPTHQMADVYLQLDPTLHVLAQGFFDVNSDILGHDLQMIINDISTCTKVAECEKRKQTSSTNHQQWLFLQHQALVSRALSFQPASLMQDCIRIALIVWLLKITAYFGAQKWSKKLLPRLKGAIVQVDMTGDLQISPLLLWMTSLGAMTAEYTDERDWYLRRTSTIVHLLQVELEKDPFRQFLQRFLFVKSEDGLQFFRMLRAAREVSTEV